ncbi:peptidoglycan glycosyltransferase FtsW [Campylobacter geochelonis]|uniref:Probable peptidoglycan glycosyltransferase FtsW n=1 Tax=Campylobacter geochelonis TaxID=1780362 RepID=A0A128EKB3_9BACT|nr:putative peptidoglycan glycosyltransferase FtsW [Campylobacter geochelonis]CZE49196.1 dimethyladenosine transferase [Campylobacter geochelonis]CZE49429.1 dimethyladenosine transferase [Campylobacter geochelonis]CZE51586.1 dimethyladenosine transferase [Campylobacter geochelonis]
MRTDRTLFYVCTILITIGVVFSLSLTAFTVLAYDYDHLHFFIRQFGVGVIGVFLMWSISMLNPDKILTFIGLFLFLTMFVVMITMPFLPPSIVKEVNGANRWIRFPGISFAPVEFFKIGFIYFLAWSFTRKIDDTKKSFWTEVFILFPYTIVFSFIIYIIAFLQNDLGQIFVLSLVLLMMVIFAGTSFKILGSGAMLLVVAVFLVITMSEHRIRRVYSWWAGIQDIVLSFLPSDIAQKLHIEGAQTPYQISHSLNAINNGGFFGQGLGMGTFKLGFLSEVHTDFVLAGIAEEAGFFMLVVIVGLFFTLLYRIFKISSRAKNNVYYLFSLGIGFMFLFSFMVNSYGITSLTPVKGLAVPFISYGGSQLLAACFAIGLVLMVSKKSKLEG